MKNIGLRCTNLFSHGSTNVTMFSNKYVVNGDENIKTFLNKIRNSESIDDIPSWPFPLYDNNCSNDLYHYTSADALLAIITNAKKEKNITLHLSRVDCVNDPIDGWMVFNDVLKDCKSKWTEEQNSAVTICEAYGFPNSNCISYVCALSMDNDSLPLWNCYANKGVGYNMFFDVTTLYETCATSNNTFLIPVIYDCNLMYEIIVTVLEKLSHLLMDSYIIGRTDEVTIRIIRFIALASLAFKHPSYSYEHEVRIVKIADKTTECNINEEYKQQGGILKPYIKMILPKEAFYGVTVGPLVEADIAERTMKNALRACRLWEDDRECCVDISKAPIRFL
jgi:hypothetical protein